eukprot:COSAG05_NODE_3817_length_1822_cov_1.278003_2_plen_64_part_00
MLARAYQAAGLDDGTGSIERHEFTKLLHYLVYRSPSHKDGISHILNKAKAQGFTIQILASHYK